MQSVRVQVVRCSLSSLDRRRFRRFLQRCGNRYIPSSNRSLGFTSTISTMAQVPTPPESRQTSESPEIQHKEAGAVDLDGLLERYLGLLDRHQRLQADLAKQLSSVRFPESPGRFPGEDITVLMSNRDSCLWLRPTTHVHRVDGMARITTMNG